MTHILHPTTKRERVGGGGVSVTQWHRRETLKDIGQEQAEQALLLSLRAEVRRDFVTTMPGGPEETSAHMCLP